MDSYTRALLGSKEGIAQLLPNDVTKAALTAAGASTVQFGGDNFLSVDLRPGGEEEEVTEAQDVSLRFRTQEKSGMEPNSSLSGLPDRERNILVNWDSVVADPGFLSRIPDPTFFPTWIWGPGSRIRTFSIPDPGSASRSLSILTQKNGFLALENMIRVVHPGSRMRMLTFYPCILDPESRIQGSKRPRIPDPNP
jgi:hypothetical protein